MGKYYTLNKYTISTYNEQLFLKLGKVFSNYSYSKHVIFKVKVPTHLNDRD